MPAVSEKQREMMAIAEHHPDKLYKENRGVLKMGNKKLHEFSSTLKGDMAKKMKVVGKPDGKHGASKFVRWGAHHKGVVGKAFAKYDSWHNRHQGGGVYEE